MFNNMATFMSPPLVTIAMGQILMAKFWSAAAWWRTILAICLLFEVSRWYGLETVYRDLQLTLCIVAGLVMVTRSYMNAGTKALIMVSFASFFVGGMLIGNEGTIAGYLRLNLFSLLYRPWQPDARYRTLLSAPSEKARKALNLCIARSLKSDRLLSLSEGVAKPSPGGRGCQTWRIH